MDKQEFLDNVAELFEDTPREKFTMDLEFKNLDEWSSLSALSVIAMADEAYDVEVTGSELRAINTLEELYNLINKKL